MAGALCNHGQADLNLGDVDQAEQYFDEAYALCQTPDWQQHVYTGLACLGMGEIALGRRDYDPALEFLREGLRRCLVVVIHLLILNPLAGVIGTMPSGTAADVGRAAKLWGATEALNEKLGTVPAPGNRRRTDAWIAEARSRIAPKTFDAAWAEGRALSLDQAIELAMI